MSIVRTDFGYKEFSENGSTLNREDGVLYGATIGIKDIQIREWYMHVEMKDISGRVKYAGQTQIGQPHDTNTDERVTKAGFYLARKYTPWGLDTQLSAGFSRWRWNREILPRNGVAGLSEIYYWWEFEAGIGANLPISTSSGISTKISYLRIIDPWMEVDLSRLSLGTLSLPIGEDNGYHFELAWATTLREIWQFEVNAQYKQWRFDRGETVFVSNGNMIMGLAEPESLSKYLSINFVFTRLFD